MTQGRRVGHCPPITPEQPGGRDPTTGYGVAALTSFDSAPGRPVQGVELIQDRDHAADPDRGVREGAMRHETLRHRRPRLRDPSRSAAATQSAAAGTSGIATYSVSRSGTTSCPTARPTVRALLHETGAFPDEHFPLTARGPVTHRWYATREKGTTGEGDQDSGWGRLTDTGRDAKGTSRWSLAASLVAATTAPSRSPGPPRGQVLTLPGNAASPLWMVLAQSVETPFWHPSRARYGPDHATSARHVV